MKKALARITALSTALFTLALSTSISFAANGDSNTTLSGDDYGIALYKSNIHDVTDTSAYLWAYTEGEGSDLAKVRVYSYFYVNGNLKHQDYDNGTDYASIDYEANVKALMKAKITSSHYAYNKIGDKVTETSEREYPN
ncbi:hypothetical protein ACFVS2_19775 [Brevibacillus sp. NPDC058079]|uniref:hypothetical protein n=1 Tax=Brevibacillus sp. NPDC058079 TaxID=3346330 RepID=UPI0036E809AA